MHLRRNELTELCKRARPEQWTRFITANRVIKIVQSRMPIDLHKRLMTAYFEERQQPDVGLFYDASRTQKGRQSIQNRLLFMRSIVYPWNTEKKLSNDITRIEMKRTFFPYFKDKIISVPDGATSGFFPRVGQ
jgi:hypothetical protein